MATRSGSSRTQASCAVDPLFSDSPTNCIEICTFISTPPAERRVVIRSRSGPPTKSNAPVTLCTEIKKNDPIWGSADDVLRDLFKRDKSPDITRHFHKPQRLRGLAEISAAILAIEEEADGLLGGLLVTKAEA